VGVTANDYRNHGWNHGYTLYSVIKKNSVLAAKTKNNIKKLFLTPTQILGSGTFSVVQIVW